MLVQEAAYSLLHGRRQELHARIAQILQGASPIRPRKCLPTISAKAGTLKGP